MTNLTPPTADVRKLSARQFNLLVLGLLTVAVGQSFVFAILPPLGREVDLSVVQINVMIACSALVFSFASPSWGRLSDRLGRKPVIVTGLTGYAVGNLIFALAFEVALERWITGTGLFALLLAVRCAQSLVMSGTNPGCTAYTADHSAPQYRTRALARLGTASSIGMIIGPVLAGALAGLGLLFPLYCATGLAALAAYIVWRYLPPSAAVSPHQKTRRKLSVFDPRLRLYLFCSFAGFTGFAGIQQNPRLPGSRYAEPLRHPNRPVHGTCPHGNGALYPDHAAHGRPAISGATDHTDSRGLGVFIGGAATDCHPRRFRISGRGDGVPRHRVRARGARDRRRRLIGGWARGTGRCRWVDYGVSGCRLRDWTRRVRHPL